MPTIRSKVHREILYPLADALGAHGADAVTPDVDGNATIAHGLAATPTTVLVGLRGDNVNGVDVESVDGTNITVRVKDAAGADVAAGTFTVDWWALP